MGQRSRRRCIALRLCKYSTAVPILPVLAAVSNTPTRVQRIGGEKDSWGG